MVHRRDPTAHPYSAVDRHDLGPSTFLASSRASDARAAYQGSYYSSQAASCYTLPSRYFTGSRY